MMRNVFQSLWLVVLASSLLLLSLLDGVQCFAPPHAFVGSTRSTEAKMMMIGSESSSSMSVAVDGIDPAAALSQVLAGFLGSPAILAVPIFAAFSIAAVVAWFIVSSANPEVDDDEE